VGQAETVFIHLSDIHFKKMIEGRITDVDDDVRNELVRDAKQESRAFGEITGVLVTGDIAFSGSAEEYEIAENWLAQLCVAVECNPAQIWVVPGNHDIDRQAINSSASIQDCHDRLRKAPLNRLEAELERYLQDNAARDAFLMPLKNYNDFAKRFECQLAPGDLYWEDNLPLNDGWTLRLRGLNSVLVSDWLDNDESNATKLILTKKQIICRTEDGVVYLTLCHHPPDWCRDQDGINDALDNRVHIQLFGHKHRQRVELAERRVRITAGAANPDTRESDWKPCYNFIAISVVHDGGVPRLVVRIQPRIWSEQHWKFVGEDQNNGGYVKECIFELYSLSLPHGKTMEGFEMKSELSAGVRRAGDPNQSVEPPLTLSRKEEPTMNPRRRLAYRFYTLPYNVRLRVAQDLELVRDEDQDVPDAQLFERYFKRAQERKTLAQFWESVENEHPTRPIAENPFSGE